MKKAPGLTQEEYEQLPDFERKQLPTFVKSFDEDQGIVEHFVAITGNVDEGDDRIMPGAFVKSINERGNRIKVLDQHSTDSVTRIVGRPLELREVGKEELTSEVLAYAPDAKGGLLVRTQYAIDTTRGRDVFNLVKGGYAPESSIGYDALQKEHVKERDANGKERIVRNLNQVRLWEYSNVIWGMNRGTAVISAKAKEAPTEGKPYGVIEEDGKYCVYKLDADGKPTGERLGEHETRAEAATQARALYANEDKPEKADEGPEEEKAGRVLNARIAKRIIEAVDNLHQCLKDAGLMEVPDEEDGKNIVRPSKTSDFAISTGPQKSDTPSTSDATGAGTDSDSSTRLLKLIEIEQEKLKLSEV